MYYKFNIFIYNYELKITLKSLLILNNKIFVIQNIISN